MSGSAMDRLSHAAAPESKPVVYRKATQVSMRDLIQAAENPQHNLAVGGQVECLGLAATAVHHRNLWMQVTDP